MYSELAKSDTISQDRVCLFENGTTQDADLFDINFTTAGSVRQK